jgi:hypothetical protein
MADMASATGDTGNGVAFLVSAGIVYEIIAFACSSPQTAEINIRTRGGTLMKWVHLGEALGVAFVVVAGMIDPKHRAAIWIGGAVAIAASETMYRHAAVSGMRNPGPGTEQSYAGEDAGMQENVT